MVKQPVIDLQALCQPIAKQMLQFDRQSHASLGIVAVIVGGSLVYEHAVNQTIDRARDFDGAVLVRNKSDLETLFNQSRARLMRFLRVAREECPDMPSPPVGHPIWNSIDGVRYAGFDDNQLKKSIKVLTVDHFHRKTGCSNLLSYKDRRVYEGLTITGKDAYRLQHATSLKSGLVALHDPWLFESDKSSRSSAQTDFAFGISADLLLTGCWLVGDEVYGKEIRGILLQYAAQGAGRKLRSLSFARSRRFNGTYSQWLAAQTPTSITDLSSLIGLQSTTNATLLFGCRGSSDSLNAVQQSGKISRLDDVATFARTRTGDLEFEVIRSLQSSFSNNSQNKIIRVQMLDQPEKTTTVLSKEATKSQQLAEREGAFEASKYFALVQQPVYESGRLLYPYFEGTSEAEAQLKYLHTGENEWLGMVLDTEMRKAEDTLRAYKWSLLPGLSVDKTPAEWYIHRFFHDRLRDLTRLQEFYGTGVSVDGTLISLRDIMDLPITINDTPFPCLASIHSKASKELDLDRFVGSPVAFGLGDAHGGNIMIGRNKQENSSRPVMYIDYEVSGYHSPILDLAKPLYNDVFFNALYADSLTDSPTAKASIEDGALRLTLRGKERTVSKAILNIKRQYLVEPFMRHAAAVDLRFNNAGPTLACALFACGVLTRNFSNAWDAFHLNLCHAVVLSQARTLPDVWDACDCLLSAH